MDSICIRRKEECSIHLPSSRYNESFIFNISDSLPERTKYWREQSHTFSSNLPGILHLLYVLQCEILTPAFVAHYSNMFCIKLSTFKFQLSTLNTFLDNLKRK